MALLVSVLNTICPLILASMYMYLPIIFILSETTRMLLWCGSSNLCLDSVEREIERERVSQSNNIDIISNKQNQLGHPAEGPCVICETQVRDVI